MKLPSSIFPPYVLNKAGRLEGERWIEMETVCRTNALHNSRTHPIGLMVSNSQSLSACSGILAACLPPVTGWTRVGELVVTIPLMVE